MSKPLVIGDLIAPIPVIQGGMRVGVSLSNLAGNVAKCGGIGIISTAQIGYQEPEFDQHPIETNLKAIKTQIQRAKEIAQGGIVGVNIMVATKKYEEYVRAAVKAGADLIISGAGLPTLLPVFVEKAKTKIAPIVSSIKSASVICKLWDRKYKRCPDLVVIEGPKAGGHLGFSLEELRKNYIVNLADQVIFIINQVINELVKNPSLLKFISKNLSWGIYNKTILKIYEQNENNENGIYKLFLKAIQENKIQLKKPEVTLYMIIELVSSTCFNSILYNEPLPIKEFKPYLYETIRNMIETK